MIKAIALDDEPLALDVIAHFCSASNKIQLEKTFTQQTEAIKHLNKYPVDLLFLDIEMPRKNGIDFFKELSHKPFVIFVTAYSEYAVEGFNVEAIDYLVKPIANERFQQAIHKVEKHLNLQTSINHLVVRADYKLHKIEFDDILFIEALDDHVKIFKTDETVIVTRMSMKKIIEKLPSHQFVRTHRSFIVSGKHLKSVQNNTILINDFTIPIGNTYKENIKEFLLL